MVLGSWYISYEVENLENDEQDHLHNLKLRLRIEKLQILLRKHSLSLKSSASSIYSIYCLISSLDHFCSLYSQILRIFFYKLTWLTVALAWTFGNNTKRFIMENNLKTEKSHSPLSNIPHPFRSICVTEALLLRTRNGFSGFSATFCDKILYNPRVLSSLSCDPFRFPFPEHVACHGDFLKTPVVNFLSWANLNLIYKKTPCVI